MLILAGRCRREETENSQNVLSPRWHKKEQAMEKVHPKPAVLLRLCHNLCHRFTPKYCQTAQYVLASFASPRTKLLVYPDCPDDAHAEMEEEAGIRISANSQFHRFVKPSPPNADDKDHCNFDRVFLFLPLSDTDCHGVYPWVQFALCNSIWDGIMKDTSITSFVVPPALWYCLYTWSETIQHICHYLDKVVSRPLGRFSHHLSIKQIPAGSRGLRHHVSQGKPEVTQDPGVAS
jgi:hypothetical protein